MSPIKPREKHSQYKIRPISKKCECLIARFITCLLGCSPCGPVEICGRFRCAYYFHNQGDVSKADII